MIRRRAGVTLVAAGLAVLALAAGTALLPGSPAEARPVATADHVIVVGVPGLRWDDVSEKGTPELWRLAGKGSIGALSIRAATRQTCVTDGWVTLAAGNRAAGPSGTGCQALPAPPDSLDGGRGRLAAQASITARNGRFRFGARIGALADSVRCVAAVGPGAAVAGAHPSGRLDLYTEDATGLTPQVAARCPVTVVDGGVIDDDGRAADLTRLDATLRAVDRARPARTLLAVVGIADPTGPPRLHVAVLDGAGTGRKWLTSASTRREPYVQLVDVAPTVLTALGLALPPSMTGRDMTGDGGRDRDLAGGVRRLTEQDRAAGAQRPSVQPFFTVLVIANLVLMAAMTALWRWRRKLPLDTQDGREPGSVDPALRGGKVQGLIEVGATAVAAVPVANYLANLLPWWRVQPSGLVYGALLMAAVTGILVLAYRGPWRRPPYGPAATVAAVTALYLALDVLLGSPAQLHAPAGYSPLVAGRFTGFGNLAFAVFATGALVAVASAAQGVTGRWRPALFAIGGVAAVLVVGAPMWGSDVGGIVALTPAFVLAGIRASGRRLSAGPILGAMLAGLVTVTAFALADYARPETERTHLGRFVAQLSDGTAGDVVQRKAEANLSLLVNSQLTILVLGVALFVPIVLLSRDGGLRRVFGLYPCLRAGMAGVLVAAGVGFAVNDSGVAVPAFMAAVVVPLIVAITLRVGIGAGQGARRVREALPPAIRGDVLSPAPAPIEEPVTTDVRTDDAPEPADATAEPADVRTDDGKPVTAGDA